ncbi:MAG: hypothetical protein ACRDQ9_18370 [Pseudonocardiaceae bacterium]
MAMSGEGGAVDDRTVAEVAKGMRALLAAIVEGRLECPGSVDQLAHVVEPVVAAEERLCRRVFAGFPREQLCGAKSHVGRRYGD